MDNNHAEGVSMMPPRTLFTLSFASIGSGLWAAAELQQWPPIIISVTIGTIAFWFAVKNAVEDRRYTTLMKRYAETEEDYEKRATAYEEKIKELKDRLDAADDEIRTNRHNLRDLQNHVQLQKAVADAREANRLPIHADKVEIQTQAPTDVKQS